MNVVQAIEEFGNGFLDGALIERLRGDDGACRAYYQEVLMVVYRIIFMLFAEQRGMLGGGGDHGDLFLEDTRLRRFGSGWMRSRAGTTGTPTSGKGSL